MNKIIITGFWVWGPVEKANFCELSLYWSFLVSFLVEKKSDKYWSIGGNSISHAEIARLREGMNEWKNEREGEGGREIER